MRRISPVRSGLDNGQLKSPPLSHVVLESFGGDSGGPGLANALSKHSGGRPHAVGLADGHHPNGFPHPDWRGLPGVILPMRQPKYFGIVYSIHAASVPKAMKL